MSKTILSATKNKVAFRGSRLDYKVLTDKDGYPVNKPFKVGQVVLDELTGQITSIIAIKPITDWKDKDGNIVVHRSWEGNMIQVESRCKPDDEGVAWDTGWRYSWEVNFVQRIKVSK